ncbi:glycosyltransferase [Pontibacter silvestris]|uniref:Glycosyltransferase n=1 Tax=Pontibacter silvestris TaxID=2305183 RepID=A0ABW4WW44_9BACT|nr:glycosyltransferase [Pontibacter silvestris]MCC9137328.1 glycosyltransferase [Pontibacter silvestris]
MVSKPEVLVFIDWFLPGYKAGGPIKSVANIVLSLKDEVDFSIVTSNTDFGEPVPYAGITPNIWMPQQGYRVMYLDAQHQKLSTFKQLMREQQYDIIYLNSLFSINFTLLPLLAYKYNRIRSKVVLAPRGMLGQGALAIKNQKKKVFLHLSKVLGLFKHVTWHASTALEAAEIQAAFSHKASVKIATNIATLPGVQHKLKCKSSHYTSFFFLSRIAVKKNLLGALHLLRDVSLPNKVDFHIIGPVEDEVYWQECQAVVKKLPENIQVHNHGPVPNHLLPGLLQDFHFMLLPTFSENYGHVVVESWASGCPVVLSDQTPWHNLEAAKVGWEVPLKQKEAFLQIIERCILMENEEFQQWSRQTQHYLQQKVVTKEILEQNRKLFSLQT